jgi:hypothetical protein
MPRAQGADAPTRTPAPDAEGEGGGRSRACMSESGCEAGFHETSDGEASKALSGAGRPAEPAKAAGIAPRLEPEGRRRKAQARAAARTGLDEKVSAFEKRSGKVAKPSGGAAIRKGFREASASRRSSKKRKGFGSAFFRNVRPERLRSRCEPEGTARLRPGPIRKGSFGLGFGLVQATRRDRGGASCRSSGPAGAERGFAASLRDPRKAKRAFAPGSQSESRPARDGLATQRRQSKLGQVGAGGDTGPHSDSRGLTGASPPQSFQHLRNWCLAPISCSAGQEPLRSGLVGASNERSERHG